MPPRAAPSRTEDTDTNFTDDQLRNAGLSPGRRSRSASARNRETKQSVPAESRPQPSKRVTKSKIEIVRAQGWNAWPWLVHGFSTRPGGATTAYRPSQRNGELNLGFTASDTRENVLENRRRFLEALGAPPSMKLVTLKQLHSSSVRRVREPDPDGADPCKGDGLMTNEPGILLAIQTADCIPVLVADLKKKAVAAFHAGWRGTVKRIVESGVGKMRVAFRSRPEDLVAAIGPGIANCCYAVGEEVLTEFTSQFDYAQNLFREVSDSNPIHKKYPMLFLTARAPGHSDIGPNVHLDLAEANRRQLLAAGLRKGAIFLTGQCTGCRTDRFFSHRTEQGFTGR